MAGRSGGAGWGGGNAVCSHAAITFLVIVSLQAAGRKPGGRWQRQGLFVHVFVISFQAGVVIFPRKELGVVGEVAEGTELEGGSQGGVPGLHGSGPPGGPAALGFGHPNQ